jgi:hypothetical protein
MKDSKARMSERACVYTFGACKQMSVKIVRNDTWVENKALPFLSPPPYP